MPSPLDAGVRVGVGAEPHALPSPEWGAALELSRKGGSLQDYEQAGTKRKEHAGWEDS